MRKLILSMQMSLDGIIEAENGDSSWMQTNDEEQWKVLFSMLQSVDLLLLGRVMFPEYRDYWKGVLSNPKATANETKYARLAEKTPHIVFSKTLTNPEWQNTRINNGPVAEEVRKIKQQPGSDIYVVGGARFAATLIEAGLVDEYRLTVNPVVLGKGKSFFQQQTHTYRLQLIESKTLESGVVILIYKSK